MLDVAVSTAAGGACAGSAAVLYFAEKLPGINRLTNRLHTDRAQAALIVTASAAMIATPAGAWWNRTVNSINDWAVGLVGDWTGLAITGIPALLVALYFVNDMITRHVEMRTRVLAAVLPILAVTVPGPIGSGIQAVLSWAINIIGTVIGWCFGVS